MRETLQDTPGLSGLESQNAKCASSTYTRSRNLWLFCWLPEAVRVLVRQRLKSPVYKVVTHTHTHVYTHLWPCSGAILLTYFFPATPTPHICVWPGRPVVFKDLVMPWVRRRQCVWRWDDELGCCKFQLVSHSVHSLPKANLQVMHATLATVRNCLFLRPVSHASNINTDRKNNVQQNNDLCA